jgi:hypothetical protein
MISRNIAHSKGPRKQLVVGFGDKTYRGKCAADVFVDVLCDIGLQRVFDLNLMLGSSPLVARSIPLNAKQYRCRDGWYVKTHCSTPDKHSILERIAKRLGIAIETRVSDLEEELLA